MAASDPPTAPPDLAATMPGGVEPPAIGPMRLFTAFSSLALSGFGGVLPFAYRALVEQRKWLDAREFASLLAIAQVMPGPTICNLSVMIGQRFAGAAGACAALAGMVLGPSCIVVALGIAWQHYGGILAVKNALGGMSAVAIGLIAATGVKMGIALFRPATEPVIEKVRYWTTRRFVQIALCALAFVGVGILHWPLAAVVAALAPIAIAAYWTTDPR